MQRNETPALDLSMKVLSIPDHLAEAFERLTPSEQQAFWSLIESYLQYPSYKAFLDETAAEASLKGLTPEILEDLMKDVS